jgi:glycosyltransferase involved in cell wall biosynthesis
VGRLDYQKGFDRLIDAWRIVVSQEQTKGWHLDIFGQGHWQDKLQGMIDEYGIATSATINKPTTDIWGEYAASSILVMSSHYEGFPMVMIEAMSCGVPVVSFDFPAGAKDIIENGKNGILVKNDDVEGLADAMILLMQNDGLRKELSDNAIKVTDTYSENVIMEKWVNLFNSLATE